MNTVRTETELNEEEIRLLKMLHNHSKICDGMQINFVCARLGIPQKDMETYVNHLQEQGLIQYQKYGVLRLTENGNAYLKNRDESATLVVGEKHEKSYYYSGLL